MGIEIITGDTVEEPVTLTINDDPMPITSGARVEAMLRNKSTTLVSPTVQTSGATGADWDNGIVVVEFTASQTDAIDLGTPEEIQATLEIQIVDGDITESFISDDVLIRQGYIPAFDGLAVGSYIVTGVDIDGTATVA